MNEPNSEVATVSSMGGLGDFTTESLDELVKSDGASKGTATIDDVREAMGNVKPELEVFSVQGHGANSFKTGTGELIAGDVGITGIVLAYTRHNSYFDTKFGATPPGTLPPCFSNDGAVIAPNAESPNDAGTCGACPRNRDATDRDAKEAAFAAAKVQTEDAPQVCTNYVSLAVALPGRDVPIRIRFTAQAFKVWARYNQHIGTVAGRFKPHQVLTHITLENKTGGFGDFSVPVFTFKGGLPDSMAEALEKQVEQYTSLLRRDAENEGQSQDASDEAKAAAKGAKADADAAAGKGKKGGKAGKAAL